MTPSYRINFAVETLNTPGDKIGGLVILKNMSKVCLQTSNPLEPFSVRRLNKPGLLPIPHGKAVLKAYIFIFQFISKSIRDVLMLEDPYWNRSITLPPKSDLGKD